MIDVLFGMNCDAGQLWLQLADTSKVTAIDGN